MQQDRRRHEECALATLARMERYVKLARQAIADGAPSVTHAETIGVAALKLTADTAAMLNIDLHLAKAAVA